MTIRVLADLLGFSNFWGDKGTEGQRVLGEWFFFFVPLNLCPFVPSYGVNP